MIDDLNPPQADPAPALTPVPASATPMTPVTRLFRTVIQVLVAVAAAVPAAVGLLHLSAATSTKVVGFAGAAVIIISALQNAFEAKAGVAVVVRK